jgi:alpha-tubulin suppressor-like RCC1 family protein
MGFIPSSSAHAHAHHARTQGTPVQIATLDPLLLQRRGHGTVVHIACGADHSLAVTDAGAVLSWGSNRYGQIGHHHVSEAGEWAPSAVIDLGLNVY